MSKSLRLATCTALAALAAASLASAAPPNVGAKDTFHGRVASATGRYRGAAGKVDIYIIASGSGTSPRTVKLVLAGHPCGTARHCIKLSGTVTGVLIGQPTHPDVGQRFTISAAGTIKSLGGHVAASGTVDGTGFIARGQEEMELTLASSGGTVTVTASSPVVPGFTSP